MKLEYTAYSRLFIGKKKKKKRFQIADLYSKRHTHEDESYFASKYVILASRKSANDIILLLSHVVI